MNVDLPTYRRITHDTTSYDGDVVIALGAAQSEFENCTGRILMLGTYTETLEIYDDGSVYPSACPVVSVADPADATFDTISIQSKNANWDGPSWPYSYTPGYYGYVGIGWAGPDVLLGVDVRPPRLKIAVTYSGGYATLPPDITRCLCEMAQLTVAPSGMLGVTGQISSITLGDQSISGKFGSATSWPTSVSSVMTAYTRVDP